MQWWLVIHKVKQEKHNKKSNKKPSTHTHKSKKPLFSKGKKSFLLNFIQGITRLRWNIVKVKHADLITYT